MGLDLTKLCSVETFSYNWAVVAIVVLYFCLIVLMMTAILFLSKTGVWISYSSSRVWNVCLLLTRIIPVSSVLKSCQVILIRQHSGLEFSIKQQFGWWWVGWAPSGYCV